MISLGLVFFTKVLLLAYVIWDQNLLRTPSLWLTPSKSAPYPRFSLNNNLDAGTTINRVLLLKQWYHLAYTLSDLEKRMDFYIDGEWVGFQSIQPMEQIVFNVAPLYIGNDTIYNGITGQISNFRYFNWRLSADEVIKDFLNNSSFNPTVSSSGPSIIPSTIPPNQPTQPNNAAAIIAGIAIGASLGSILLTLTGFYIFKSYRKKQKQNRPEVIEESGHEVITE